MAYVYLAGKIRKNGWRRFVVPNLRKYWDEEYVNNFNELGDSAFTCISGLDVSGPFFISCDHGCYHGKGSHGVGANGSGCAGDGVPASAVPAICMEQIKCSDFVFAYIDDDTCYGTMLEIGYAIGNKIPVAIMFRDEKLRSDMWFVAESAEIEFSTSGKMIRNAARNIDVISFAVKIAEILANKKEEAI